MSMSTKMTGPFLIIALGWCCRLLLIGIPVLLYISTAMNGALFAEPFPFPGVAAAVSAVAFMMVLGLMEEFGWRGVAQALQQRRLAPVWGLFGGIWHLPAFSISGVRHGSLSFLPFFVATAMGNLGVISAGV